jgi:CBS domain-containing protein
MNHIEPIPLTEEPLTGGTDFRVSDIVELLPSAATVTPITEAMTRTVICALPEMAVSELMRLFVEQGISGVPVVDGDGKPIGVVSKTDVVRELCENPDAARRLEPSEAAFDADPDLELPLELCAGRQVRHVMTPLAIVVGEGTSIARAAAVMAYEKVHRVIVVNPAGSIVGLVSAIDVLRWLSRHDGYAIP